MFAIWERRDKTTGLVGSTIDIQTGVWIDTTSSLGAGTDSFFEYMFKAYVLFGRQEYLNLFNEAFASVLRLMQKPALPYLFANVDMQTGNISNMWVDSLQAYVWCSCVFGGLKSLCS
jgi:mannosidase alpha-like ER degradation enhancer 1